MRRPRTVIGLGGALLTGFAIFLAAHHDAGDALVRTTIVGQNPTLIVVDSRTGRAFVLDQGSLDRNNGGGIVEGSISVLDTRSGAVVRTVPAGTAPQDVAIDEQTNRVFVLNSYFHNGGQGTVTVLDAATGRTVRTTQVGDGPVALELDPGARRVFVLNQNNGVMRLRAHYGKVSVLDAAGGRISGAINASPAVPVDSLNFDTGTLALDARRHRLFLTMRNPNGRMTLDVFDARSDRLISRLPLGSDEGNIAVSTGTGHAFLFADARVIELNTARGSIVRAVAHRLYALVGQTIVDERTQRVFVADQRWNSAQNAPNWGRTDAGSLAILDARTGTVLRTLPIEWPHGIAVDERTGRLLISHAGPERSDGTFVGNGHVDVRDGHTGRLLRTITVGIAPGAMAVDPRTGHLLVVNGGGSVHASDAWGWIPAWLRQRIPLFPSPPASTRHALSSVSVIAFDP